MNHWAYQYIGRPWISGARGPDAFDCWGLLWWIKRVHFSEYIPEYPGIDATNLELVTSLVDAGSKESRWTQLPQPADGCAVGMSKGRRFHHVGIFAEIDGGMVLHAHDKGKVVAQSISSLRNAGYRRIEFFQYHGAHS